MQYMRNAFGYILGILLFVVGILAIMLVQVLSEEKRLRQDFGQEYADYCKRTRRF